MTKKILLGLAGVILVLVGFAGGFKSKTPGIAPKTIVHGFYPINPYVVTKVVQNGDTARVTLKDVCGTTRYELTFDHVARQNRGHNGGQAIQLKKDDILDINQYDLENSQNESWTGILRFYNMGRAYPTLNLQISPRDEIIDPKKLGAS